MVDAGMFAAVRKLAGYAGPSMRTPIEGTTSAMPQWFPARRMMDDLATLKEQDARILEILEAEDRPCE